MIRIESNGISDVRIALQRLDQRVRVDALRQLAQSTFDRVQTAADRHSRTGALARSVALVSDGDSWIVGHRLQMAPYAIFVHWGTRPHLIKPRQRKALRWAKGGRFRFAKAVRHPGYRGDPWLVEAAARAPREFDAIVRRLLSATS